MKMTVLKTLLLVVVLHLLISLTTTAGVSSSASTMPRTNFEQFDVQGMIKGTKIKSFKALSYEDVDGGDSKLKLKLVHRDVVSFKNFSNHGHRFSQRMNRDIKRVASLNHRLVRVGNGSNSYGLDEFGSEVVSGMEQGSGEYFVRIGIGSPARNQYMVIDSGSDIVWVQCQPCSQCYKQTDPVFDPASSVSFTGVACKSTVCGRVDNAGCRSGRCRYEVSYGDGSYTKGTLALETLTLGSTVVQNIAIGCGHRNQGMFVGAAGLMGLGGGSMSFVGQLSGETGGAFGYCLVSRESNSFGSLVFGRDSMPAGAVWVPLLRSPKAPTFYYVGMAGLGVGGVRVPVTEDVFGLTEVAGSGVVMDTGTAVTRLPVPAYEALRNSFVAGTATLPRVSGVSIFDTCYDLSSYTTVQVPTVSFYFTGGPILTLPAKNFLIPVDEMGTFCFAFAPTTGISIIGNIQQEGIQISFDSENGYVGFGPNTC